MTALMEHSIFSSGIASQLSRLSRRLAAAPRLFLFTDFDGTLAPIVEVPSDAAIPAEMRSVLGALSGRDDIVTTVISGRALDDLQPRVGLPLIYAGNHGMEIRGPGFHHTAGDTYAARQLAAACNRLRSAVEPFPGAKIEDKGLTASVHVRHVARPQIGGVRDVVHAVVRGYPALRVSPGLEVFEVRPRVGCHKGTAARWILERLGGTESDTICIGDDSTDEDMFREFADGVTVRVGNHGATSAQYRLDAAEVRDFLWFVLNARMHGGNGWPQQVK